MKEISHTVSIVVIARNEDEHLAKCLGAAMRESESIDAELLFVDCGSTDSTLEIALTFPIKVVKMSPDSVLMAAAAREVGRRNSAGEYLVFVDGDCVLDRGWISRAISVLHKNPRIAGVMGQLDDVYIDRPNTRGPRFCVDGEAAKEIDTLGGNAVYRCTALEEVGGFNPYIRSLEEQELCYRLRKAGDGLLCLPSKMATHYTEFRWSFRQVWKRFRIGLCDGYGQVLRAAVRNGVLMQYVKHENRTFLFLAAMFVGLACVCLSIVTGSASWILLWCGTALSGFAYLVIKNKSVRWPLCLLFIWFLNCMGMLKTVLLPLGKASSWQPQFDVVSERDSSQSNDGASRKEHSYSASDGGQHTSDPLERIDAAGLYSTRRHGSGIAEDRLYG